MYWSSGSSSNHLINLSKDCAFTEEVWLLSINDDVVKVAGPVSPTAALQTTSTSHQPVLALPYAVISVLYHVVVQCVSSYATLTDWATSTAHNSVTGILLSDNCTNILTDSMCMFHCWVAFRQFLLNEYCIVLYSTASKRPSTDWSSRCVCVLYYL